MEYRKLTATLPLLLTLFTPSLSLADELEKSIADLDFLIGDWRGEAVLSYPREDGRDPRRENVEASCAYILNNTYIQCDTAWTREDGATRTFRLHFNYNALDEGYQTLFVYDNWPRHVSYLLHYDDNKGAYVGRSEFEDDDGVAGEERVIWRVAADGSEIQSEEYNHLETDPDDYWPRYFEFVWRKASP